MQDRGSQGCSGVTVGVGAWNAPLDDGAVVVVTGGAVVVGAACAAGAVVAVVGAAGGGFTLKSVPVTTVTCEPGCTCVGSSAMSTAPDMELATAWAAAKLAAVLEA